MTSDEDLILYSEDGVRWLTYRAWIALIVARYPERLRDCTTPPPDAKKPNEAGGHDQ